MLCRKCGNELKMGAKFCYSCGYYVDEDEDYVDGIIRVYNSEICDTIDNYNCSSSLLELLCRAAAYLMQR